MPKKTQKYSKSSTLYKAEALHTWAVQASKHYKTPTECGSLKILPDQQEVSFFLADPPSMECSIESSFWKKWES